MKTKSNRTQTIAKLNQGVLFSEYETISQVELSSAEKFKRKFVAPPKPVNFYIGATKLPDYLKQAGILEPFVVADALNHLDWSEFENDYHGAGRPPYAPRLMAGIILYGMMRGIDSLRGLEFLAKSDLGCWWISHGIQPDHSNLGRFILRHQKEFEGSFFTELTSLIAKKLGSRNDQLAGDGTMIQASGSRYRRLKEEALVEKLEKSRQQAEAHPEDKKLQYQKEKYIAAHGIFAVRKKTRQEERKSTESLSVCTTEPEAVIQPLKNKAYAPSYKASVMANQERLIVAADVHPSSEIESVVPMLNEAEAVIGHKPKEVLFDSNYTAEEVLVELIDRDIGMLAPEYGEYPQDIGPEQQIRKREFIYQENEDVYVCPMGQKLKPTRHNKAEDHIVYTTSACQKCPLKSQCVVSKTGNRLIKRYGVDKYKDALRQVMTHPHARKNYAQRKAMVEPVFSHMTGKMNFRRFRRRGLKKVRLEFKLHAAAYNLTRLVAVFILLMVTVLTGKIRELLQKWAIYEISPA